ncbi:MAG: hypothetical protein EOO20_19515 [Chryseobacterium sp.]|nr:MAG: hypothetical protein EOO20_19515 [Chryseobacterium sp.]
MIRRVDKPYDEVYDDDVETFFPVVFEGAKKIPGLSLNLLCLKCGKESTNYKTKGDGSSYWNGAEIDLNTRDGEYEETGTHTNVYLNYRLLSDQTIPLIYADNAAKRKELEKNKITELVEGNDEEGQPILKGSGTLTLVHRPTNLNYWHYELSFTAENKTNAKSPNKTVTKALEYVLDHIMSKEICSITPFGEENFDPKGCYLDAS